MQFLLYTLLSRDVEKEPLRRQYVAFREVFQVVSCIRLLKRD